MSVTDFMNSILGFVYFGLTMAYGKYPGGGKMWVCHLQGIIYPSLAMTTFYILGLLTYERYRAIVVNKHVNKQRALKSVGVVWTILFIYSGLPWFTSNTFGRDELKATGAACFVGGGEGIFHEDMFIFINVCLFLITTVVMVSDASAARYNEVYSRLTIRSPLLSLLTTDILLR